MFLEFCGQSQQDSDNRQANTSRLVNCYREPVGGRGGYSIKAVPGTSSFASLTGVFVRAMGEVGNYLYAACGGVLWRVSSLGGVTNLGATDDSAAATIAGNNGDVTLCIGGKYYLWDGTTLTEPTAGAFSSFGSLDYLANYTILSESNGRQFQWSNVADASDLPGLNFSSADGRDDNILRVMGINGQLYIFKETSYEVWYVTGQAGASAFERVAGGVIDTGLKSFGLICKIDGAAFFVGDDNRAHILGLGPVSIPAVETAIATKNPKSCLTYEDEGHTFCAIIFDDCAAWVYDLATREWHERAQGGDLDPWQVSVSQKFGDNWYLGKDGGSVFRLGQTYADADGPLVRVMQSNTLEGDGAFMKLAEIEIFPRIGFDAATIELRLSRNGGHSWTDPKQKSWAVGEYDRRIIWRGLGAARRWTAEVKISDAVNVPVNSQVRVRA